MSMIASKIARDNEGDHGPLVAPRAASAVQPGHIAVFHVGRAEQSK